MPSQRMRVLCLSICLGMVALLLMDVSESRAQIAASAPAQPGAECASVIDTAVAVKLRGPLDKDGLPPNDSWGVARPVLFCADWQGNNPDAERATEVRMIWSPTNLFTFADQDIRRDQLWTRDVAEVFIQPNSESGHTYKEIEISPNGDWLDLSLTNGKGTDLNCKMKTRAVIDEKEKIWIAELAIPMQCLTREFDPKANWRVNFFRVEGQEPNRFYSAWQATKTSTPNFHVPEAFGVLQFSPN
jgi:hypothetical protein